MIVSGIMLLTALRFAWPAGSDARVELTDERTVGDESRTIVMTMRLRVEPDGGTDRVVARLSDASLVSINGKSAGAADPSHNLVATSSMMSCVTPTMVVSRDGRYLEARDLDRLTREIWAVAGLTPPASGLEAFSRLLSDVAAEDWNAWVGAWLGNQLAVGESTESERKMQVRDTVGMVRLKQRGLPPSVPDGRTKLDATAVYPSESVRVATRGVLIDMALDAKKLKRDDPAASERFLEAARYSPLTETLTVELETATMRPVFAERTRSFSAVHGKLRVEGLERRTHRFTWVAEGSVQGSVTR